MVARRATLAFLVVLALPGGAAHAAPGDLDRSFGVNGVVDLAVAEPDLTDASDIAAGPNGTIFVLSVKSQCGGPPPCDRDLRVARVRAGGSLDGNYGTGGTAAAFPGTGEISGSPDIAVDSLGRAVIAARQGDDVVISRLDPDGDPDPSFGGIRRLSPGATSADMQVSLAVLGDDRVVAAASWSDQQAAANEPLVRLLVARLRVDGALDPAFGSAGVVNTVVAGSSLFGSFAPGRDGSVIAVGESCCRSTPREPILVQIPQDGSYYEPEFGSRIWGESLFDTIGRPRPEPTTISADGLFVRRNGRLDILVVSRPAGRADPVSFLLRVRPNGHLDRHFGKRGVRRLPRPVRTAAIDSEGRIVVISEVEEEAQPDGSYALRLSVNGRPDRTFGGGSLFLTRFDDRHGAQAATFSGQRPVIFDQHLGQCGDGCVAHPTLIRLRGGGSREKCLGRQATIVGTRRGETLNGTNRVDVIAALGGADTVRGRGGDDLICGGPGNDTILDGPGRDRIRP